jgi:hypothetical protein
MSGPPTDVIIGSVVVITATTLIRNVKEPKKRVGPVVRPIVAGFMLAVVLLAISIVTPGLAKGLALMGLVGAFAVNGPALIAVIGSLGK